MSTFRPAASMLANFNNTLSTISTIRLFIYISCSHQGKNQRLSWHHSSHSLGIPPNTKSTQRTYTRESKPSVVPVPRYQLFTHTEPSSLENFIGTIMCNIDDLYDSILLSCTCYQKSVVVLGCGQFCFHY